jgi:hypothetical protein
MSVRQRLDREVPGGLTSAAGRPILLVTMGTPFDEEAVAVAVDAAVESGEALIVANITRLEPLALSVMMGYDALEELTPDVSRSVGDRRSSRRSSGCGSNACGSGARGPSPPSSNSFGNGNPG